MPEYQISIVIPLLNEEESLPELHDWIVRVMNENKFSYEIIFVDDGSTDNSWQVIESLKAKNEHVKGIKFTRNYGKSGGLFVGFKKASGDVVFTMDADLQDNPEELPEMYRMVTEEGYDLVSGWKKKRYDPILSKNLPSKLYNWTARQISGIKLHDFNCGLKAYKRKVVKSIEVYGDMHRYIPVLAKSSGFKKIGEKVVLHQERKYGTTKFGMERFIRGPLDLLSVIFLARFGKSPMHFFGPLGVITFLIGMAATAYVGFAKLYRMNHGIDTILVTDTPYFYIALTMMIIGVQLFMAGFLGELVARKSSSRNEYIVEEDI
jgi:glycosyltransferase involved in cell wall biosynthesis